MARTPKSVKSTRKTTRSTSTRRTTTRTTSKATTSKTNSVRVKNTLVDLIDDNNSIVPSSELQQPHRRQRKPKNTKDVFQDWQRYNEESSPSTDTLFIVAYAGDYSDGFNVSTAILSKQVKKWFRAKLTKDGGYSLPGEMLTNVVYFKPWL